MIESKEIQEPIKAVVWYSKGWLHNGSHFVNLIEYWLGKVKTYKIVKLDRQLDAEDIEATVHVELERGEAIFICGWEEYHSNYTIELLSRTGKLNYLEGGNLIEWRTPEADKIIKGYTRISSNPKIIEADMVRSQYQVAEEFNKRWREKSGSMQWRERTSNDGYYGSNTL